MTLFDWFQEDLLRYDMPNNGFDLQLRSILDIPVNVLLLGEELCGLAITGFL